MWPRRRASPLLALAAALGSRARGRRARARARRRHAAVDGRDRLARGRPRRQRQRDRGGRAARARPAALAEPTSSTRRDPALDRRRGIVQRGDEGVRRAPLRRAPAREHLLPLHRHARLADAERAPRRGLSEDARVPADALALLDGLAAELGIELVPNLRLRNGTDGLEPLAAGYPTATVCSVTELKQPANYHWPTDTAENVDYATLADAIRLCEAAIRRLDERWL